MELDIVKLQTTWNDAAESINSNNAKFKEAIELLQQSGGAGGGADIDLTDYATKVWVEAKGYITASALTPYLKTDDAEDTYATKDYVTTKLGNYAPLTSVQGFENRIGGLEGAVPQLNERVATVEGKVSSLNETVSTGENNLLDRVNTIETDYVTSGNLESAINGIDLSAYLLKADFTKSRIQSTLGISDWALASAKPTYTASEVGALGVNNTAQSALKMTPEYLTDLNSATKWRFFDMNTGYGSTDGNKPNIAWVSGITGTAAGSSNYRWQLAVTTGNNRPYFRQERKGDWSNWNTLAFTSDIPTKLSQFTDDVVAGKYLSLSGGTLSNAAWRSQLTIERSGSANDSVIAYSNSNGLLGCLGYRGADGIPCVWLGETGTGVPIIHANNIGNYNAGSADSANKLNAERLADLNNGTIGRLFYSTFQAANTPPAANYFAGLTFGTDSIKQLAMSYYGDLYTRYSNKKTWSDWKKVAFTDSNVASATKLATPRTLWGQSFDGTSDVNGYFLSTGENGGFALYSGIRHNEALSIERLSASGTWLGLGITLNLDGYVGIGTTSPTEKLDVAGNVKASGNINATSITINGVTITASNGSITVNGNVLATGDITGGV